jgi:hypothetical protein
MEASVERAVVFSLRGEAIDIIPVVGAGGAIERLTYRSGDDQREFSGEEISHAVSPQGTRATVMLQDGAADEPVVALTVTLPVVEAPHEGPFDVSAAALVTTSRSLFGGLRPGPQQSYEAITLTGTAACGYGAAAAPELGACRDWSAVHDRQPPGPPTLIVTGTCTMPTPGYTVQLRRHRPQGINPRNLLLDKVVRPPDGIVQQALTDLDVRYEEPTDVAYDTVTILPDGPTLDVVVAV